jgi:8-oxo-dGTP pyrophosphatase MutT (NUDIX family)/uncharacterized protein YqgV (UPF0045/DUF77 family)
MTEHAGEELVEWVDDDDRLIDVIPRSRMRQENLLHRSVAIIVTTTEGELVVQRRSDTKDVYPGWWDIGAGGVLTAGEEADEAATRELYEELGVHAEPWFVGVERYDDDHIRELCRVYRVVHDGPFTAIDGEAAEIRVIDTAEFAALGTGAFLPSSVAMLLHHVPGFARSSPPAAARTMQSVQRIEFTVEPFVEAQPGAHVTAPVDALQAMGVTVDIGPFGSSCDVDDEQVGAVVAAVATAAIANGATHLNLDISRVGEETAEP